MKSRKITAFLLICGLMVSMLALYPVAVSARWLNTASISCDLNFSGRNANCSGSINAYSGSTISGTLTLERKNGSSWDFVKSWTKSSSNPWLIFDENFTVSSAGTYRVVLTATVTRAGVSENVSITSSEKTCT